MSELMRRVARLRVPLGAVIALAVLILARPTPVIMITGIALAAVGELVRIWASGFIRKNAALATSGPYRYTRNPLYVGNLLAGIGVVVASGNWWLAAVYAVYYAVTYSATITRETAILNELFPREFMNYCQFVPAFFPRLWKSSLLPPESSLQFDSGLVWKNREYRALISLVLIFIIFLIKLRYPWP